MSAVTAPECIRQRLLVRGVVQGVGFRPFVYGLAARYGLAGFVGNNSAGVFIEAEGPPDVLAVFANALRAEAPPLAQIEAIALETLSPVGESRFTIVGSGAQAGLFTLVSPDIAVCGDCLRELFDPANRRYRYPFINCTHCGPRYTIIRGLPYDRPQTTMAGFPLCADCQREYDDPLDRRFHAQPIACPVCGPQVWLEADGARVSEREDAIAEAQLRLAAGEILAIKGIGGFHLACDATHEGAVRRLRERKGRADKPFALMARDLEMARALAHVSEAEANLLTSRARPIVLLEARTGAAAESVAPGLNQLGLMLPYAPLHYLLLNERPLVMTSGNWSGEPICFDDAHARERLAPLADAFLLHDRPIEQPCDDSVLRVFRGAALPVRRSRGYAPLPVKLLQAVPPLLAVGAELKNTFCIARGEHAFLSPHIGDLESIETMEAFEGAVRHFERLYGITPERLVCDLHPGYASTRWAEREAARLGLPLVKVQHHHAHIAGLMAEHGLDGREPVLGLCFDGTGYGSDGAIWGGEVLLADYHGFRRLAHLSYVPLPGGDSAIRHPARAALAYLWAADVPWAEDLPPVAATTESERRVIRRQLEMGFNAPPTSSAGRLFDAVAALIGLRPTVTYEAQAAMELEGLAATALNLALTPLALTPGPSPSGRGEKDREGNGSTLIASALTPSALTPGPSPSGRGEDVSERSVHPSLNWRGEDVSKQSVHPSPGWRGAGGEVVLEWGNEGQLFALSPAETLETTRRSQFSPLSEGEGPGVRAKGEGPGEGPGVRAEGEGPGVRANTAPLIAGLAAGVRAGLPPATLAAQFHVALADAAVRLLLRLRDETGVNVVALSGGVFQNVLLLGLITDGLAQAGFTVLTHEKTPPNDGGLALGQAIIGGLASLEEG